VQDFVWGRHGFLNRLENGMDNEQLTQAVEELQMQVGGLIVELEALGRYHALQAAVLLGVDPTMDPDFIVESLFGPAEEGPTPK
jgi:hypothetical protein